MLDEDPEQEWFLRDSLIRGRSVMNKVWLQLSVLLSFTWSVFLSQKRHVCRKVTLDNRKE